MIADKASGKENINFDDILNPRDINQADNSGTAPGQARL